MRNYQEYAELETPQYGGCNTALQFSLIPRNQSPKGQNMYMDQDGDLSQRPGTVPVTSAPLGAPIEHMTLYKSSPSASAGQELYATSATTLYKWNGTNALSPLTMSSPLNRADIQTVGFTDRTLTTRLLIGDGTSLKQCDGSLVTLVNPAPNDAAPAPANVLSNVNTKGIKFIFEHTGHVFMSPGTNELFYSKRYTFDYVPEVQYFFLVRDNDYVNGNGVSFDEVCLVPLRRGWAILTGENFNNFAADRFLNTDYGVIAPRTITKITYPDGNQSVVYLSDNGMNEVYTAMIDKGGRQYATRSIMQGKINFDALGLTEAEKAAAVGEFHPEKFLYLLSFKKSGVSYTYAYDVRSREWYTDWLTFSARAYVSFNGTLYFGGQSGHLHKFDDTLNTDWNEANKATGTPVVFRRYSPSLALEFTGFPSMWDAYLVESKQWKVPATLDITFIFSDVTDVMEKVIKGEVFVEGTSQWGYAKYANVNFTDLVNEPNEIVFEYSRLSKYVQVLWENPRDEPVKIFKDKFKGRTSGR